jgi:curli biogenesis system outer membrane secretion channel CsgG
MARFPVNRKGLPMNVPRHAACLSLPLLLSLAACSTPPNIGAAGAKTVATGAAGGATAVDANSQLEHCDRSLGTLAIVEESNQPWVSQLTAQYRTQSTVPLLRMIIQQSNCFVIVERGQGMRQMQGERELMQSGELRKTSNIGKGQMVAADYTMTPSITFSQKGTSGGMASFFQHGLAGASSFSNTPEGKVLAASFMDSYNQMVRAVRSYKAQSVDGGLGNGGVLKTN